MAVVVAIFGMIHFVAFLIFNALFIYIYKKDSYEKSEIYKFVISLILVSITGFFVSNHLALISDDSTYATSVGFSIVPITQIVLALFSYIIIQILNRKNKNQIKYASIFLGIMSSAPVSLAFGALLSPKYWELLGRSVYG